MSWSERREGNSFQAKFFRFKDRILPAEPPVKEIVEGGEAAGLGACMSNLRAAWRAMDAHPDSEEAYREACSALRSYRELLLSMGVECPPYADPED